MTEAGTQAELPLTPLSYRILLALCEGELHGYGIIKAIEAVEGEWAGPSTGALYLALQRMEGAGLIGEVAAPEGERDGRRRYYGLTERGRAVLRAESERLATLVSAARARNLLPERGG